MDLLANVPNWDEIERNLDYKFGELNQSISQGWQNAQDGWDGFTRRVNTQFDRTYGQLGGDRINAVREALYRADPIILMNLKQRWASIEIDQVLDVLRQLVKEVSMILGGSIAIGSIIGGAAGAAAFGAGAGPGAVAGAGVGLQIGNLILMGMGLSAIAEYFYRGLPGCLATLQDGIVTAWHSVDGKPSGIDPTGGSEARRQSMIDQASRQLASGQEQLVQLLLTAIVTYLMRGQIKAGISSSIETRAMRSARLQAEISNRQLANWLAKIEQKLLAQPGLQPTDMVAPTKARADIDHPKWDNTKFRTDGDFGYLPPLRQNYVREVHELQVSASKMKVKNQNLEDIARYAHEARTNLKLKYREYTPPNLLETIDARNMAKYGNKIGPTFETLISKGKSFEQIIESATRAGGGDIF